MMNRGTGFIKPTLAGHVPARVGASFTFTAGAGAARGAVLRGGEAAQSWASAIAA
jgi:hypothetical protein